MYFRRLITYFIEIALEKYILKSKRFVGSKRSINKIGNSQCINDILTSMSIYASNKYKFQLCLLCDIATNF